MNRLVSGLFASMAAQACFCGPVSTADLKRCVDISGPTERLACYDQLSGRPLAATGAVAIPQSPAATVPPKETFGLYSAEHPTVAITAEVITGTITSVGSLQNGHRTVVLDSGAIWELLTDDPVIKAGQSVSIKRAAMGSFIMTTSTGRIDRLHRLR